MSKRANNEGSITRLADGRWQARVTLPDGRRKAYYAPTRAKAFARMTEALKKQQDGIPVVGERETVKEYLTKWLEAIKPTVRPKTWRGYEQFVRLHVLPELGRQRVARLTPRDVQALYATGTAKGLSHNSVVHLHAVLHRALEQATKWGVVGRNVASLTDAPALRRNEMTFLSREQVRTLLSAAKEERFEALYVLAVTTGMRQGELLALRWRDVDLQAGALRVVATLQRSNGEGFVFAEPKTEKSRRQIALSAMAVTALKQQRVRQAEERLKVGPAWEDNGLVFANEVGRPVEDTNLRRRSFKPLLRKAGLPMTVRFHDLRHSAATLALSGNIHPKVVSEMLGHSQINITLDLYSHALPTLQRQAAVVIDGLLQA